MSPKKTMLHLADYDIVFDDTLASLDAFIDRKGYSSAMVLVDANTSKHCLPVLQQRSSHAASAKVITIPAGEPYKTIDTCQEIWAGMLQAKADRKSVLVNLGGGVIGDMGGFAAACYKRGIDFIQVPTTVLAQVDSSIGGKLGVDFRYGKNLVGVFKNPALVLISNLWMQTLPHRQVVNGFAEIFKHALIADKGDWKMLGFINKLEINYLNDIIPSSLEVKKRVVEEDPFEKGLRKILNFGHTIGHAIEAHSLENDPNPLLHGEAVAIGMILEAFISHHVAGLPAEDLQSITDTLMRHYPYHAMSEDMAKDLWPIMALDKKNEGDRVLAVGLKAIGQPVIDMEITPDMLRAAIVHYQSLA